MIQSIDLTFRNNIGKGRHGWIRLTPAYSIDLVQSLVEHLENQESPYVLDPFSGTGTTGLVCSQHGIPCDLYEINPFLAWLSETKTREYTSRELGDTLAAALIVISRASQSQGNDLWLPSIHNITRWWSPAILPVLSRICIAIRAQATDEQVSNLLKVAFCKLLINRSNVAFNHQSMSFKTDDGSRIPESRATTKMILNSFEENVKGIVRDAGENPRAPVRVFTHNSKQMPADLDRKYSCVITSPPYTNRISYVREVRPYMYWLAFIDNARQASNLDWEATGGTWGLATSWLTRWHPAGHFSADAQFLRMIKRIRATSPLLANYVHRYFEDMYSHFSSLRSVLKADAEIHYIVGNSKFYEVVVPTEEVYSKSLERLGFRGIRIETLRRRSSKKQLREYHVSAKWSG